MADDTLTADDVAQSDDQPPKYDLPPIIPVHDQMADARLEGYGWDEIQGHLDDRSNEALASGYDQSEINSYLGYQPSTGVGDGVAADTAIAYAENPGQHPVEAATGGMLKPSAEPADETASASAPLPGKTLSSLPPGAAQAYARALMNGETTGPRDYADTYANSLYSTAADLGADPATLGNRSAAADDMARLLPSHEDVVDAAIAVVHASGHEVSPPLVAIAKEQLLDRWADSGKSLQQSVNDAQDDPLLADTLTRPRQFAVPPTLDELAVQGRDALPEKGLSLEQVDPLGFPNRVFHALGGDVFDLAKGILGGLSTDAYMELERKLLAGAGPAFASGGATEEPVTSLSPQELAGFIASHLVAPDQFKITTPREGVRLPETVTPEQKAVIEKVVDDHANQATDSYLKLYHGTPHTFPEEPGAPLGQFQLDKIGSGEGAQAYGHGLYFAENKAIAENYRDLLGKDTVRYDGEVTTQQKVALDHLNGETIDDVSGTLKERLNNEIEGFTEAWGPDHEITQALKSLDPDKLYSEPGQLYEVNLHANPEHFLDWDKPLSEQSPRVQKAVKDAKLEGLFEADKPAGETIRASQTEMDPAEMSRFLNEAGVKGIKYLDAGSRDAGNGSRNFVVFDPKDVSIAARSGETVESYLARAKQAISEAHPGLSEADVASHVHESILGALKRLAGDESGSVKIPIGVKRFFDTAAAEARRNLNRVAAADARGLLEKHALGDARAEQAIAAAKLEQFSKATEALIPGHLDAINDMQASGIPNMGDPLTAAKFYVETRTQGLVPNPFPQGHPLHAAPDMLRDIVQGVRTRLQANPLFSGMGFIEDYYRHGWQDKNQLDRSFGVGRQGSGASTLQRSIPTELEGILKGNTPKDPNWISNTLQYVRGMLNHEATLNIMKEGRDLGHIQFDASPIAPDGMVKLQGKSSVIIDQGQVKYAYAPPGFAKVYNSWAGKGFYESPIGGAIYGGLQRAANMMTGLKLGLSGFHAADILQEAATAGMARAVGDLGHGEAGAALKNMGFAALAVPEAVRLGRYGKQLGDTYLEKTQGTPLDRVLMKIWREIGGAPAGHGQGLIQSGIQTSARDNMVRAFNQGRLDREIREDAQRAVLGQPGEAPGMAAAKAAYRIPLFALDQVGRLMTTINGPLFDIAIPNIKRGAFAMEMADFIKRNPGVSRDALLDQARKVRQSMDDRFGELDQDHLFWNRYAKQALNLMTVSIGWEFGTLRAFGGAAKDMTLGMQPFSSVRSRWLWGFLATNALQSSAMQYYFTNTTPFQTDSPVRDLLAPRTTKDGRNRAILPGYNKEPLRVWMDAMKVPDFMGALQAVGGYGGSKINTFWQYVNKNLTNTDWDNKSIRLKLEAANGAPPSLFQYQAELLKSAVQPIALDTVAKRKPDEPLPQWMQWMGVRSAGMQVTNPERYNAIMKKIHDRELKQEQGAQRRAAGGGPSSTRHTNTTSTKKH